jgi:carbon-monoxide dehydrogenase medium subunit
VATTLGAQIVLSSRRGLRIVSSGDFFVSVMTTRAEPDELIVAVRFPIITAVEGHAFQLYSRRCGDFALASVAVSLRLVEGHIDRLLLGVGAVEAAPVSLAALASRQIGRIPDAVLFAEVAAAVRAEISPEDVPRVPAIYRRELVETLTVRALKAAVDRAGASR